MASVCEGDGIEISRSKSMIDERELTVAGRDFVPPQFSPIRKSVFTFSGGKTPRRSSTGSSAAPAAAVAPELQELDLDSTLVAEKSFSSSNLSNKSSRDEDRHVVMCSSYIQAVTDGRLSESSAAGVHQKKKESKRKQIRSSFMGLLRSSSNPNISGDLEDVNSKNLSSAKLLRRELEDLDLKELDESVELTEVLFSVMHRSYRKERKRSKVLATLLIYSNVNVNSRASNGMTALHYAVQDYDIETIKVLVAFGANINATNQFGKTPLEMLEWSEGEHAAISSTGGTLFHSLKKRQRSAMESKVALHTQCLDFLRSMGAIGRDLAQRVASVPSVPMFPQVPSRSSPLLHHRKAFEQVLDWDVRVTTRYSELDQNIRSRLDNTAFTNDPSLLSQDAAVSLALQLQEMRLFQKSGSRILCLDGGGIRGLVQLEVLCQLEKRTGRKVVELFDWIIGTSTGAIIALGLVYAKKSLFELRQLYFKLKDEVFGKTKGGGMSFNTAGLEKIFKQVFSETKCMDDETYPRVLISAVKKEHINLKLRYFNNCFNDEFCRHIPVWKVARYTCAAPVLFGESDQYVDGGLLANNPSDSGLSRIQSHFRSRGEKLPISLVVSVGTGKYPSQALGNVDFLFVGAQGWSSLSGTSHLMELLSYALVEPSVADDNCRCRCDEEGIRYFRLNPRMEVVVASGETDTETLVNMILQTRKEMEGRVELANLVLCLHDLAHISNRCHAQVNGECQSSDSSTGSR